MTTDPKGHINRFKTRFDRAYGQVVVGTATTNHFFRETFMTEIETRDIFKGAYLLCSGCHLRETRAIGERQIAFVFTGEKVEQRNAAYSTGRALVNPLQLRESVDLLRDLLFEQLRKRERNDDGQTSKRKNSAVI